MQNEKKQWVKKTYSAIVENARTSCCCSDSSCCETTSTVAVNIGYNSDDLTKIPDGANLGLGCGNPLGIASIKEGDIVLDLGSGAGIDVFLAANRVGNNGKVIGIDMTPSMIEAAKRNAADGNYKNVEFRLGDIEEMPVEDNSIDLVISNCVLNLVPDKKKAFSEIVRVLKSGGRITVSDIVLDGDLPEGLQDDPDAYCGCISGAIKRDEYLQGLLDAGLSCVNVIRESNSDFGFSELNGKVASITVTGYKPE